MSCATLHVNYFHFNVKVGKKSSQSETSIKYFITFHTIMLKVSTRIYTLNPGVVLFHAACQWICSGCGTLIPANPLHALQMFN